MTSQEAGGAGSPRRVSGDRSASRTASEGRGEPQGGALSREEACFGSRLWKHGWERVEGGGRCPGGKRVISSSLAFPSSLVAYSGSEVSEDRSSGPLGPLGPLAFVADSVGTCLTPPPAQGLALAGPSRRGRWGQPQSNVQEMLVSRILPGILAFPV